MAAKSPVGMRIISGWTRMAITASFTSRAPIFLPRYSGVRPTIMPAMKIPTMMNISMLIMPTPLPPKTQFSHMPTMGDEGGQGVEAVRLGVHRAAGHIGGEGGEGGAGRSAEAQFLAFEVAQVLVHRQARPPPAGSPTLSARRRGAGDLEASGRGMGGQSGIGFQGIVIDRPDDGAGHHAAA